jgi:hypothetical protein
VCAGLGLDRGGRRTDAVAFSGGDQHGPEADPELGVHGDAERGGGQPVPDGDQLGESFVGLTTPVVTAAAGGLVEKLREALGAPPVEQRNIHRGHLPSLVTVATGPGRTRSNGSEREAVTGIDI